MTAARRNELSERFIRYAKEAVAYDSPLYTTFALKVAADDDLLELASIVTREPVPNLLLAAPRYLHMRGEVHDLDDVYEAAASRRIVEYAADRFRAFCLEHRSEIEPLLRTRLVQTNEVNRSAVLLPAFDLVARESNQPLALVEVGASAGLNLLFDRYAYHYSDGRRVIHKDARLELSTELRGDPAAAPIPSNLPPIASRVGIDLHPIDLTNPDEALWLKALVWPDHPHRATRLAAAIESALAPPGPPRLIAGDALERIGPTIAEIPADQTVCVYHSSVLYQWSEQDRDKFDRALRSLSTTRAIYRISAEDPTMDLIVYSGDREPQRRTLAEIDSHGRWLAWKKE